MSSLLEKEQRGTRFRETHPAGLVVRAPFTTASPKPRMRDYCHNGRHRRPMTHQPSRMKPAKMPNLASGGMLARLIFRTVPDFGE